MKRTMKKLLWSLLCVSLLGLTACSKKDTEGPKSKMEQDFPDPIFRAYVLENFDTDGDGKISEAEALAVTQIVVGDDYHWAEDDKAISSLKGIEYFTNLTFLQCGGNRLTKLDISRNTALTKLKCMGNQLTELDVSKNTALTELWCYGNQLTALDVSKNTELRYLYCAGNQLTKLDVSKNTELRYLYCFTNQLTTLNISGCTALETLLCYRNQLTALDVSKNTALQWLSCYSNQLTELDLSKTNLGNSTFETPLLCAPMSTLKTLTLKRGWSIKGVTENADRSSSYIPDHTEIVFVD